VRAATVGYLSVIKGAEGGVTKLSVPRLHLHPALKRAYESVEAAFRQVCVFGHFLLIRGRTGKHKMQATA
jgi:hypothetical protein